MGLENWIDAAKKHVVKKLLDPVRRHGSQRRGARAEGFLCLAEGLESRVLLSALSFSPQQTIAAIAPDDVAIADVNGDGKPDLIVADKGKYSVGVMLGNGDGSFKPPQTFATVYAPLQVVVADINGDGLPDLLTQGGQGPPYDSVNSVLLGNGDGTFRPRQNVSTAPGRITVADVSGDGIPDLLVARRYSIGVLLGNGNGTFQTIQTFATGKETSSVAVGDFNGDRIPDLVAANAISDNVSVLLGNGNGTFQPQYTYAAGTTPFSVAVVDIMGENAIVTANYTSNTISVLLGNGNGTFQPQQTYAAGSPVSAMIADINGDGNLDVVVADRSDNGVSVLLGNGDGTFQAPQTFSAGSDPFAVAVADVNGDGKPDLAVANFMGGSISVLLNGLSTTTLAPSADPIALGDSVSFTATVAPVVPGAMPTGTVTFFDGATPLSGPIPLAGGAAVFTTSSLVVGADSITATYSGDNTYGTSTSAASTETVTPGATTTTLSSADDPSAEGSPAMFAATIAGPAGAPIPTGTVTFYYGAAPLGPAVGLSAGVAMIATSSLPAGSGDSITAVYSGDANDLASTSAPLIQTVIIPTLTSSLAGKVPPIVITTTPLRLRERLTFTAGDGAINGVGSAMILLSPDENAADSALALALATTGGKLKLKSGKKKLFNLRLPRFIPAGVPAGAYHVLIRTTDTVGNTFTTDSGQTLNIVAPVVDLTGSFVKIPARVKAGKRFVDTILVSNLSTANVAAVGLLPIDVDSSPDGLLSDATMLKILKRRINLRPGKSVRITLAVALSSTGDLVIDLDPAHSAFSDDGNPGNNVFSQMILVG